MSERVKVYSREEVYNSTLEYFKGDDLASNVWIKKYCVKNSEGGYIELNPEHMHRRIAKELHRIELNYPNPVSEDIIFDALRKFNYIIPAGSNMYGIGNDYSISSLGNCFVVGNDADSYSGIFLTDQEQAQLMKRRAGVGHDISHIRPNGSRVTNAAESSTGIVPFMERFSNTTREVSQDGRRGALMLTLDIKHPDVERFIMSKDDLTKITGANISIKIDDEFMESLDSEDGIYTLRYPINIRANKQTDMKVGVKYNFDDGIRIKINARELWNKLIHQSWKSAEPGILFWDNIIKESPADCYDDFKSTSTNPCQPGWAKVITKQGIKEFNEISIGWEILTTNGWSTVINKWSTGIKDVWRFETELGGIFEGTEDHFIVQNGIKIKVKEAIYIDSFNVNTCDYEPSTIIKREYISTEEVFDITVDNDTHTYITNGCNVSNCGEIPLSPYDSCRLLSVNSYGCVDNPFTSNAKFNWDKYDSTIVLSQRLMDDIVDLESEKIDKILEKIEMDPEIDEIKFIEKNLWVKIKTSLENGRRTGNSTIGIADTLAALGMKYDSDEAISFIDKLYKHHSVYSYSSTIQMAKERGEFVVYDYEKEKNNPYIDRVLHSIQEIHPNEGEVIEDYLQYGRRNISLNTIPPAGTIGIMAQQSSGIEPVFMVHYTRRRKVDKDSSDVNVVYVDQNGDNWEEYNVLHPKFKDFIKINYEWLGVSEDENKWTKEDLHFCYTKSPYYMATANDIEPLKKVEMIGVIQKYIDHSISSTTNLPESTTEEVISDIYKSAWKNGLKGITVYRDGSRSGVLISNDKKEKSSKFEYHDAPKRPEKLYADYYFTKSMGKSYAVIVGLMDGKPYEVFAYENPQHKENIKGGSIIKKSKGKYTYTSDVYTINNLELSTESIDEKAATFYSSMLLRTGARPQFVTKTMSKVDDNIISFSSAVRRILNKHYTISQDSTMTAEDCIECGTKMVNESGCVVCKQCGYSKCS